MRGHDGTISDSVQLLAAQLAELGLGKTEFARQLGVSPDYVYRILKGRVPFPRVRETIERMAEICGLDPHVFGEYRELEQALPPSTRLLWARLKELAMSRDEFFAALGGRISRPYFNSILRGDQPFPTNRAFVQLFALALQLPPTVFKEFGRPRQPRRTPAQVADLEAAWFDLLFDKMLADRGFAREKLVLGLFDDRLDPFPRPADLDPRVEPIWRRMGELGMGPAELGKIADLEPAYLRRVFLGLERDGLAAILARLHEALKLNGD